jgi:hypothetical protein
MSQSYHESPPISFREPRSSLGRALPSPYNRRPCTRSTSGRHAVFFRYRRASTDFLATHGSARDVVAPRPVPDRALRPRRPRRLPAGIPGAAADARADRAAAAPAATACAAPARRPSQPRDAARGGGRGRHAAGGRRFSESPPAPEWRTARRWRHAAGAERSERFFATACHRNARGGGSPAFGGAAGQRTAGAARVWRYRGRECAVEIYFYYDTGQADFFRAKARGSGRLTGGMSCNHPCCNAAELTTARA